MENPHPHASAPSPDDLDDDHDPLDDRRPPSAPLYDWPDARADYLAGESAGLVAARLGVSYRTLQRRAAREGWRRVDQKRVARLAGDQGRMDQADFEPDSPLGMFVAATEYEVGELLLDPAPMRYIRFAFRRSAEAAVRGRPTEALAWARLVAVLDKVAPGVSDTARAFNSADYMRAMYAEQLRASMEPEEDEGDAA